MPGTSKGGLKAAKTNKKLYGEDFYKTIGKIGGAAVTGMKGFALDPERASRAGRKGGKASRRSR